MMFFAIEAMWTVCETVVPILPSPVVGTRNSRSILGMEIAAIMQAIADNAGPGTRAGAICFSLPISSVAGLRAREEN